MAKTNKKPGRPQSKSYSVKRDKKETAKPLGWRFTNAGAKALKTRVNSRPTKIQIEKFSKKKFPDGSRYMYKENRIDKGDINQKKKFAAGGTPVGSTRTGNVDDRKTPGGFYAKGGEVGRRGYNKFNALLPEEQNPVIARYIKEKKLSDTAKADILKANWDDETYGEFYAWYNSQYAKGGKVKKAAKEESNSPRIYVADLAAYNEGKLIGEWLDLDDYTSGSEVMEAITELLKKWSKKQKVVREEYAIHDTENIPKSMYSEYMAEESFDKIYAAKTVADDRGLPMEVLLEWMADVGEDDATRAEDAYQGEYEDLEDYAYRMVEDGVVSVGDNYYVSDTDRRLVAGEQAENDTENMSDADIISRADIEDDIAGLEEGSEEYDELIERAKEKIYDEIYNEWYLGLENPESFLVDEQGIYSKDDLPGLSFMQTDYEALGEELRHDINTVEHDGRLYVFNSYYEKGGEVPHGSTKLEIVQGQLFEQGGAVGNSYKRTIGLGKVDWNDRGRKANDTSVDIEIRNKPTATDWDTLEDLTNVPEVAMMGNVWNTKKTDIVSGGQMLDELVKYIPAGEKRNKFKRLVEIWKQYHNNDLEAGTIRQTQALNAAGIKGYEESVSHLKLVGLYDDNGYKYGSKWLYQPVPESILAEIKELAEYFPEFSSYAEGGSVEMATLAESEVSDVNSFKKGGDVAQIGNFEARDYAENRIPFIGSHLEGKVLSNGDYLVLSHGHYPIWYYSVNEKSWYGNADRQNTATARHISQSRPDWNAPKLSHAELTQKMLNNHATFDLGGVIHKDQTLSTDNTLLAHSGQTNTLNGI